MRTNQTTKTMNELSNTPENKAKFIAHHWGQTCEIIKLNEFAMPDSWNRFYVGDKKLIDSMLMNALVGGYGDFTLIKTPLSKITDEDRQNLSEYPESINEIGITNGSPYSETHPFTIDDIDYLRSRSYALPFLGLSVEEQLERNWIKLRE